MLYDTKLELSVLSALIWDYTSDFAVMTNGLRPEHFFDSDHQWLYMAMQKMYSEGKSVHDLMLIMDTMNRMERPKSEERKTKNEISVDSLLDMVRKDGGRMTVAENIPHYIKALIDYAQRRNAINVAEDLQSGVNNLSIPLTVSTAKTIKLLSEGEPLDAETTLPIQLCVTSLDDNIRANREGRSMVSMPTGIRLLDRCGGLHPSNLVLIAAMSSHGKSAMAITMANNLAQHGVIYYSIEMTQTELTARLVSREVGIPGSRLIYSKLSDEELSLYDSRKARVKELSDKIFIEKSSCMTVEGISQNLRYMHARHGLKVAIVDYLHILNFKMSRGDSREQAVAAAARDLKNLADELGMTIILLVQINREMVKLNQVPSVDFIRDSGQINEAADVTIVLYRPEQRGYETYPKQWEDVDVHGTAVLSVSKDRHGGTGGLGEDIIAFEPEYSFFHDLKELPRRKKSEPNETRPPWEE